MTLDFMKSGVIAPSMHPPQTEEFLLKHLKVLGGFHLKSAGFQVKSAGFHECELLGDDQV